MHQKDQKHRSCFLNEMIMNQRRTESVPGTQKIVDSNTDKYSYRND